MMSFLDFAATVRDEIRSYLPADVQEAEIKLNSAIKNNGVQKTGLTIRNQENEICPILYLEEFYQPYLDGKELTELLEIIAESYVEISPPKDILGEYDVLSIDSIKNHITCCLVNQKENASFLQQVPHKCIEDLAEIYQINIKESAYGIAAIKVDNTLMNQWDISPEELHTLAIQNTERINPPVLEAMVQVIEEIMNGKKNSNNLLQDNNNFVQDQMYVLTNERKIGGAAALLYPNILDQIQQIIDSDFYVLPSSTHEVLIVPKGCRMPKKELENMVREVNETMVMKEELLSNSIYEYTKEGRDFKQIKESLPKRQERKSR